MPRVRVLAALVLVAAGFPALARDVSLEQSAVQFARQEYRQAEAEHKADVEQMQRTRKALEPLQKRLEDEQKKASLSEQKRQQAKARLDQAEAALDRAWKQ